MVIGECIESGMLVGEGEEMKLEERQKPFICMDLPASEGRDLAPCPS